MANKKLRIKELCKEQGITLECLANKLNIRRTSLAQAMSRNNFSIDKLGDIADALDVPIWQLFAAPGDISSTKEVGHKIKCPKCGMEFEIELKPKTK